MVSKNIEINIKNGTDSSTTSSDTYTVLYPKSLSKNIMYDNDSNITIQDKLNNLTPNDTFEIGDILCTSKINIDSDKWKLCDGVKLNRDDYPSLFDVTNLKNVSGLKDITDTLKPADLDLQGWWECNGYYFRYILTDKTFTLYRCAITDNLTIKDNWKSLELENYGTPSSDVNQSFYYPSLYCFQDIIYTHGKFIACAHGYGGKSDKDEDGDSYLTQCHTLYLYVINDDFTIHKQDTLFGYDKSYTLQNTSGLVIFKNTVRYMSSHYSSSSGNLAEIYYSFVTDNIITLPLWSGSQKNFSKIIFYGASPSGYLNIVYTVGGTSYASYYANNPTSIFSFGTKYGWNQSTDSTKAINLVQNINNKFFVEQNTHKYYTDFSFDSSGNRVSTEIGILPTSNGQLFYNADKDIYWIYNSTDKSFYVYKDNDSKLELQYTLINSDNYSFTYTSLSPNEVPLKLQDSTYQEMQNGIEVPTITQTTQYKYYIKVK